MLSLFIKSLLINEGVKVIKFISKQIIFFKTINFYSSTILNVSLPSILSNSLPSGRWR
jgi:hypothetical protein